MILNALEGLLTNQLLKVLIRLPCIKLLKKFTDVPWLSCLQICFSLVLMDQKKLFNALQHKAQQA
jgi:hypothetical protein